MRGAENFFYSTQIMPVLLLLFKVCFVANLKLNCLVEYISNVSY